jgi:hypothetical protein
MSGSGLHKQSRIKHALFILGVAEGKRRRKFVNSVCQTGRNERLICSISFLSYPVLAYLPGLISAQCEGAGHW